MKFYKSLISKRFSTPVIKIPILKSSLIWRSILQNLTKMRSGASDCSLAWGGGAFGFKNSAK